jgi:M6 family metalloprotease-like protein
MTRYAAILLALLAPTLFSVKSLGDELARLKESRPNAKPVLERLKNQPRQYQDAVCRRNILGRIRQAKKERGFKSFGVDTVRVLVIKAQFQTDDDPNTTGNGQFDYQGNGQPIYINNDPVQGHNFEHEPPHDSVYIHGQMLALRNYYWAVSGGRLWIEFRQVPDGLQAAYTLPHQMSFYSDFYNNWDNWGAGIYVLLRDAIEAADADPADISFRDYQSYMIIHAGSCWQTDPWGADIPSVFIRMDESSPIIANAGADTIYDGIIDAETQSQDGMVLGSQGEIAHEFGHQLGLPDLYDYSYQSVALGEWELMSWGSFNMNAYVPPHLSAWCKVFLGWSDPIVLPPGTDTTLALRWVAKNPNDIVKIPINTHEYYLIENRRAQSNPDTAVHFDPNEYGSDSSGVRVWKRGLLVKVDDYDISLPFELGGGGLLVYHVDEDLIRQRWEDNSLQTGNVKAIDLEEADHIQDLERWWGLSPYSTYASPRDAFYAGNNDRFDDFSDPPTKANNGSYSHISLSGVSVPGESMTARFKVGWDLPGFPVTLGDTVDWNSPNYAVLNFGTDSAQTVVLLPGVSGKLYCWRADGQGYMNRDTIHVSGSDTARIRAEFAKVRGNIYSSPAVGDVDRDGRPEVFISAATTLTEGYVYGFRFQAQPAYDTTESGHVYPVNRAVPVPGFPVRVDGPVYSSPVLADIDGNDTLEVMVAADDKKLHAWRHTADSIPGFPVNLGMETRSTPAAVEIPTTGLSYQQNDEVYVLSGDSRVFGLRGDGTSVPGYPALQAWVDWVSSSVALCDVDNDGRLDVIACNKKGLFVLNQDGTVKPGWPCIFGQPSLSSPAVGDIDGDALNEIAIANGDKLYAFNYNGTLVAGFPVEISKNLTVQSSPIIIDLDGKTGGEILIGSPDGRLCAYDGKGETVAGFPLTLGGGTHSTPIAWDLDGNRSTIELAVGCDDGKLYVWSIPSYHSQPSGWYKFHANFANTGFMPGYDDFYWDAPEAISNLYVYPNPVKKTQGKIRFKAGEINSTNCKVFNLAGDLVQDMDVRAFPRTDNEIKWDTSILASGIYIIRVEVSGIGGAKVLTCKAAVIK